MLLWTRKRRGGSRWRRLRTTRCTRRPIPGTWERTFPASPGSSPCTLIPSSITRPSPRSPTTDTKALPRAEYDIPLIRERAGSYWPSRAHGRSCPGQSSGDCAEHPGAVNGSPARSCPKLEHRVTEITFDGLCRKAERFSDLAVHRSEGSKRKDVDLAWSQLTTSPLRLHVCGVFRYDFEKPVAQLSEPVSPLRAGLSLRGHSEQREHVAGFLDLSP